MTWEDVVALGRALPEVELATSYGSPSLKVRGKLLTRLRVEDDSLVLLGVALDESEMLIEADPRVFHTTPHYDGYPTVLARLASLEAEQLHPFLARRWRGIAPKRLVARLNAGTGSDADRQRKRG